MCRQCGFYTKQNVTTARAFIPCKTYTQPKKSPSPLRASATWAHRSGITHIFRDSLLCHSMPYREALCTFRKRVRTHGSLVNIFIDLIVLHSFLCHNTICYRGFSAFYYVNLKASCKKNISYKNSILHFGRL